MSPKEKKTITVFLWNENVSQFNDISCLGRIITLFATELPAVVLWATHVGRLREIR